MGIKEYSSSGQAYPFFHYSLQKLKINMLQFLHNLHVTQKAHHHTAPKNAIWWCPKHLRRWPSFKYNSILPLHPSAPSCVPKTLPGYPTPSYQRHFNASITPNTSFSRSFPSFHLNLSPQSSTSLTSLPSSQPTYQPLLPASASIPYPLH